MSKSKKALEVENFNLKYPIGTAVKVRMDAGDFVETVTRSQAELLGGHTPVIWLQGISGCYLLDRVTAVQS